MPPVLSNSSGTACAISQHVPAVELLLSTCCNTTAGHIVKQKADGNYKTDIFDMVHTEGYTADGCNWRYCYVTGQGGIDTFGKCLNSVNKQTKKAINGKCFTSNSEKRAMKKVTSGTDSIHWRGDRKKKQTVSAALLIALGVAGIVMGS